MLFIDMLLKVGALVIYFLPIGNASFAFLKLHDSVLLCLIFDGRIAEFLGIVLHF